VIHVSVQDHYKRRAYAFAGPRVVIGSAPDADLVLDKDGVAAHHIAIEHRAGELFVDDLRRAKLPRVVEPEDVIRIAGVDLRIALRPLALEAVNDDLERRLLEEIRARPSDPEPRSVYADWLDEHGHAARAEFLRCQLAARDATGADDPAFAPASARLAELAPAVGDGWRARVAMAFIERCPAGPLSPGSRKVARKPAVGLELVCPMRWDMLAPTAREDVRTCSACNKHVTYCTTVEQASVLAQDGHCVAIDIRAERKAWDLDEPPMVGRPSPPLSRYGKLPR
jgi:uncharacterized protein (TIGR02996 family)